MQDILADFLQSIAALLAPVGSMPLSAPFVAIVSVLVALLTTWATKKFSDVEQTNADMEEIKAWQVRFNEARKTMNQVLLEEVMADQGRIMKMQGNMMSSRMKPMCITLIPIFAVFGILSTLFGATPVAILPFHVTFLEGFMGTNVQGGFGLYFIWWYMLTSMSLGMMLRKFLGVRTM
ncbi:MAG: DUF106 domain-containing protein [Candidatus Thorarchaeota archaeon]|nr:DUF106 domain-containing protein [Candidatus Thorarchaeota archaeon]